MLSSVVLPLPEGPTKTTNDSRVDREVHAADRLHFDFAAAIGLDQAFGTNQGHS